jgi:hypothetical protein
MSSQPFTPEIPFIEAPPGKHPAWCIFKGIEAGALSERTLRELGADELTDTFQLRQESTPMRVLEYYRDAGFKLYDFRTYFDLMMSGVALASLATSSNNEIAVRTLSRLLDDEYAFFSVTSDANSGHYWSRPSLQVRLQFLLGLVERLHSLGDQLGEQDLRDIIPDAPWLSPVERLVQRTASSFTGRGAFERIRRDVVLERARTSLELAILKDCARVRYA